MTDWETDWDLPADTGPLCDYPHPAPKAAAFGHLCAFCWQRLHADLVDAPTLVEHLLSTAAPAVSSQPLTADPVSRGDPSQQGVIHPATEAADDLHSTLAAWALLILDTHPAAGLPWDAVEHLTPPPQSGWWWTHGRFDVDPDTGEGYESDPRVAGFTDPSATRTLVAWLLPLLGWAAAQDWAVDLRTEVGDVVRMTGARWPTADRSTRPIPDVPCPECDLLGLAYTPAPGLRLPFVVACTNEDCGHTFPEDEWSAFTLRLALAGRTPWE